jgi:acetyltransferase-like isoleucine patch superfamily enzyme
MLRGWDEGCEVPSLGIAVRTSAQGRGLGRLMMAHLQPQLHDPSRHDRRDLATVYPAVHLGGGCVIEEGATLGTGCVIVPNVRVGRRAVVGAGATVVRDVLPDTTVVGNVARPKLRSRVAEPESRSE